MDDADGASDIDRGLARLDPLYRAPANLSRVLCVVFGLLPDRYRLRRVVGCVFTENGQSYDELVWKNLHNDVPSWATGVMNAVAQSWLVIAVSCTIAAIAHYYGADSTPLVVGRATIAVFAVVWLGRHPVSRVCCRVRSSSTLNLLPLIPRLPVHDAGRSL